MLTISNFYFGAGAGAGFGVTVSCPLQTLVIATDEAPAIAMPATAPPTGEDNGVAAVPAINPSIPPPMFPIIEQAVLLSR